MCFEIRECEASRFFLLSQDCFCYAESFAISYEFRISFLFLLLKCHGDFDKDYLKSVAHCG